MTSSSLGTMRYLIGAFTFNADPVNELEAP